MKRFFLLALPLLLSAILMGCGEKSSTDTTGAAPSEQADKPLTANDVLIQAMSLRDGAPGFAVDKAKALELFAQADSMGETCASFFLGVMYENGEAGAPDNQKALEWYTKAQKNGCPGDPKRVDNFIAKHKK